MPRKSSEAKSYLQADVGGAAPAPVKRKRTTTRAKAAAQPQPVNETVTNAAPETPSGASLDPAREREEIARLAYLLWEARGGQDGSAEDDWLQAEREVMKRRTTAHY